MTKEELIDNLNKELCVIAPLLIRLPIILNAIIESSITTPATKIRLHPHEVLSAVNMTVNIFSKLERLRHEVDVGYTIEIKEALYDVHKHLNGHQDPDVISAITALMDKL